MNCTQCIIKETEFELNKLNILVSFVPLYLFVQLFFLVNPPEFAALCWPLWKLLFLHFLKLERISLLAEMIASLSLNN